MFTTTTLILNRCTLSSGDDNLLAFTLCCQQLFLNGKTLSRAGVMTPDHRHVRLDAGGRLAPRMVYQRRQREVG
jgi:hypothetical protein